MSRFKNDMSAAISAMVIVVMVLAAGAGEAKAGAKAPRKDGPPAGPQAHGNYSNDRQANRGARNFRQPTNRVRVGAGDLNGDRIITSRRSRILPYLEQGNIYPRRRP